MHMQEKELSDYRKSLRERILETALHHFCQIGIRAVKMDDIAQELAISKRTLYEIYENKEVLLFEAVKCYNDIKLQELQLLLEQCNDVMDLILSSYRKKVEEAKTIAPQFYSDLEKYPQVFRFLNDAHEQTKQSFTGFLRRGVDEGYFRSDIDYDLVALCFDHMLRFIVEEQLYLTYTIEELFHNVIFVTLRGFCTPLGVKKLDNNLSA